MKSIIARFTALLPVTAALALSLLTAPGAHAQTQNYSYQPTPVDMNDFDHHSLYTWNLNTPGVDTTAVTITGASLTFTNIANWEKASNEMHLWMFDTAVYGGVKQFADDKSSNGNVSDLTDDFSNARYHNGKDANGATAPWLIGNNTQGIVLGSSAVSVTSGSKWNYDAANSGWQYGSASNNWADATTAKTVTFTFGSTALAALNSYIANGNNVAFGFDPDCHYYNDGVTFAMTTSKKTTPNAVPEPGLLTFIGTSGLPLAFGLLRARKRKMAA